FLALGSASARAQDPPRPVASHPLAEGAERRRAPGAPIEGLSARVTFTNQVSRILQAHCQSCHHAGDIAPFSLVTYEDAYANRHQIRIMTETRQMPPWHVDTSCARFAD